MNDNIQALSFGSGIVYREFTFSQADLTDTDTSQAINLMTLPAGHSFILGVLIKHDTAFSGGTVSGLTVSVGSSVAGATGYAAAYEICSVAAADTTFQMTTQFKRGTMAAETVQATFTATGGNLDTLTAGSVKIGVLYGSISSPTSW